MKLLRIQAYGLKLFDKEINIDFYAKQRVNADKNEMLTNVYSNIYINNVISMVGVNASGKTTTLKVISFVLQMLNNKPINSITCNDILEGMEENDEVVFSIFFITNDKKLVKLSTIIKNKTLKSEINKEFSAKYYISSEKLWIKSFSSVRSKNDMFDFSDAKPTTERNNDELFLSEDVSLIISLNKRRRDPLFFADLINCTNFNILPSFGQFS